MHPNNKQSSGYNFQELAHEFPALNPYLFLNKYNSLSFDFSKREGVLAFNKALLQKYYDLPHWELPPSNLCPFVPGKADYLHYLSDILGTGSKRILDIGTGASLIYPLLGSRLFDWHFVATDTDKASILHAQSLLDHHRFLPEKIKLREQPHPANIFQGIMKADDAFDACICNPPFFESAAQQVRWHRKKWKGHGTFTIGTDHELICEGGEQHFIARMISESKTYGHQIKHFTCLVSRASTLRFIEKACTQWPIHSLRFIPMKTGRKESRMAVWEIDVV